MNEQEILMRQKIEKREKFDMILAYVMLVLLLAIMAFIIYLKFIRKEDNVTESNNEANTITIANIVNNLNSSVLVSNYLTSGATFNATSLSSGINIKYTKEDININIEIPQVGNELVFTITPENEIIMNDIYKEIATNVCTYYGNPLSSCKTKISNLNSNINGIRIEASGDNKIIYIDITRKIDVSGPSITYNEKTITGIDNVDYALIMNNLRIDSININTTDTGLIFTGNIYNLLEGYTKAIIKITLYDENQTELATNSYLFDENNILNESSNFSLTINFNENITKDNVKEYSIEAIK